MPASVTHTTTTVIPLDQGVTLTDKADELTVYLPSVQGQLPRCLTIRGDGAIFYYANVHAEYSCQVTF